MKMLLFMTVVMAVVLIFTSCATENADTEYLRFSHMYIDLFDTFTNVLGYARTQEEFNHFSENIIHAELSRLYRLFDKFNGYQGINNIKTINENAGVAPVEVDAVIINMLKAGIEAYHKTNGVVNIAIGPVTSIWREYITAGEEVLPDMEMLRAAGAFMNIEDIVIDEENSTVFLRYAGMSLDVGSIGKGFAMEYAAQKAIAAGFESFVLSIGGDTRMASGPRSGDRDVWGVGVLDPHNQGEIIDAIFVTDTAVFTSGNYSRFYMVDGRKYHHIIDPRTLMPAGVTSSVTVIYPDSVVAENLSLAAFILDIDEGMEIIAGFLGAQAMWVLSDGTVITTEGW